MTDDLASKAQRILHEQGAQDSIERLVGWTESQFLTVDAMEWYYALDTFEDKPLRASLKNWLLEENLSLVRYLEVTDGHFLNSGHGYEFVFVKKNSWIENNEDDGSGEFRLYCNWKLVLVVEQHDEYIKWDKISSVKMESWVKDIVKIEELESRAQCELEWHEKKLENLANKNQMRDKFDFGEFD